MEISKYIISAKYNNSIILYNTLTTSLITVNEDVYNDIFINANFNDIETVRELRELGFIVDSTSNQLALIENLRRTEIESDRQIITIFTTNKCNARCYYCFEKGIRFVDMSEEIANNIIQFINSFYTKRELSIMWFGGEPLMSINIIKYITLQLVQKGYKLKTHITTNGSLITQEFIDFLKMHYAAISFQVTIDDIGIRYGKIKRYVDIQEDKAFDLIINNCKLLLTNEIPLSIRINYDTNKIESAKKVFLELKNIFKSYEGEKLRIYLAALTLSENCHSCNEKQKDIDDLLNAMTFAYEQKLYNPRAKDNRQKDLSTFCLLPKSLACGACRKRSITIDAEGYIFKCHRFAQYPKYRLGHVSTGLIDNNEYRKRLEDYHVYHPECQECNILPLCQQGCFAINELYSEKINCEMKDVQSELLIAYYKAIYE